MSAKKPGSAGAKSPETKARKQAPAGPRGGQDPAGAPTPAGSRITRTAQAIGKQVSDNPFMTLAGAAAVTAGIALLLPSSRREAEVMGDLAGRIGEVAREAADSAVEVGRQQVAELAQSALGSVGGNMVESLIGAAAPEPADEARGD